MSIHRSLLAAFFCLAALAMPAAAERPTVIGILPVYDNSAETLTESLAPNLTYMIYRDLLENPVYQPVLLTPGGLYDPDAVDWITEYATKAKVDIVLIPVILPSTKKNDRHRWLTVEVRLLNVATGKVAAKAISDPVEIANIDLYSSDASSYILTTFGGFEEGPKAFEKHPLGKAARKLVDWTHQYLMSALSGLEVSPTGVDPLPMPATCEISFNIRYLSKRAISKSYTLIADNMDESSTINDGMAHFTVSSGPLSLRVQVRDEPYGVRTEKLYQASTILDCTASFHNLVMEIGNAGDALLRWK